MPKVHLVIPARYHSTRLLAKPLLPIHGQPMILWTAKRAQAVSFADTVCVATDDARIEAVVREAGIRVAMTDSAHASGTDRLAQVARDLGFADDDIVINVQGDEPMVPQLLLEQVMQLLLDNPECAMATLCEPIDDEEAFLRASVVKVVMDNAGRALYFSRAPIPHDRDGVGQVAYRHLGLYAYRVRMLKAFSGWQQGVLERLESLEQLRVLEHGERIACAVAKVSLPAGVDTQADLDRLNALPIEALQ